MPLDDVTEFATMIREVANALRIESVPANSPFVLPKAPALWIANVAEKLPEDVTDGVASAFQKKFRMLSFLFLTF